MSERPPSPSRSQSATPNKTKDPARRPLAPGFLASLKTTLILGAAWVTLALTPPGHAAEPPADLFAYDRSAPFNVREAGRETRGAALVRDITFTPADKPVKAFLVSPAEGAGPHPAILYVHWLGEPETTNRTQFLDEAVALAGRGVVSLLVEGMWAEPDWYKNRIPEEDYAHAIRQVVELRRAMDLLLAHPGIDPERVALVGHDFGAMYGLMAEALDRRARTCVLMAPTPHFEDWFLFRQQPQDLAAYKAQLATIDPVLFVEKLAPASVFFQFANRDFYVSAEKAAEFYAAAGPRKHRVTYDAEHDLDHPQAAADRLAWLEHELGLN